MSEVPIFCNVEAGGGARAEADLLVAFAESELSFDLRHLPPDELVRRAHQAVQAGAAVIGVAGGDGSISAVAGVVAGTDTALAVFPAGTLNHFAHAIGIRSYADTAAALVAGRVEAVDVGEVNGRIFVNNASLGLYPRQLWLRRKWEPRLGKWPAATAAVCATLADYYLQAVHIEGPGIKRSRVTPLVWVAPGRGSFQSPRRSPRSLQSGTLEVVIVSARQRRRLLRLALHALRYAGDALTACGANPDCEIHHSESIRITSRSRTHLGLGIDGELVRLQVPLEFRVRTGALKVFVGERSENETH